MSLNFSSADLLGYLIMAFFIISPLVLTGYNIYYLVKPYDSLVPKKRRSRFLCYLATPLFGEFCQAIFVGLFIGITTKEWNEPLINGGVEDESYHMMISGQYGGWVYILLLLSVISVWILNGSYTKDKPPLVSVLLIGLAASGNVVSLLYCLQLIVNTTEEPLILVLYLLPFNWVLITWRTLADEFALQAKYMKEDGVQGGLNGLLLRLFTAHGGRFALVLTSLVPIAAVIFIVQILTGQGADAFIKTFTDTADWTFSQQTPPPPEFYEGHYLCTVAAGGHRRLVKPTRYGSRLGEKIIVNRQLCVANAFEELIAVRTPRFHRALRGFYDRHGYPICRFITTPLRADIVYILMKPLEWAFLLVLYLFDTEPEKRIAKQYLL